MKVEEPQCCDWEAILTFDSPMDVDNSDIFLSSHIMFAGHACKFFYGHKLLCGSLELKMNVELVDEIATEVGVDEVLPLPNSAVKRAIAFTSSADEIGDVLLGQESPAAAHEVSTSAVGCESPVKKFKNAVGHD